MKKIMKSFGNSKKTFDMEKVEPLINKALNEDIGGADVTTLSIVPKGEIADFIISIRESAVVCGLPVVKKIFQKLGAGLKIYYCAAEGERVSAGGIIMKARGRAAAVLNGERTALNFLQRLSGIATVTDRYVSAVAGTGVKILDTRKTLPGFRYLEKYAVRIGGGYNHRFGLFDQVLIKENHLKIEERAGKGHIIRCVRKARKRNPGKIVEVEVETLPEVREASSAGADMVMLDNMNVPQVRKALNILKGKAKVEVSGGITTKNIRRFARTGVDYISIGALTHSVKAIDMTLELLKV